MFRKILLVFLVLLALQSAKAIEAVDEPEIAAYPLTTVLKAGQINELRVVVLNTAKPENTFGGGIERELMQNATLTAYNLEIWLESEVFEVKSGKVYLHSLPPSASASLSFLVSIPAGYIGDGFVTLKVKYERVRSVEVKWDGSNYTAEYDYTEETKIFEFKLEVLESAKPKLKAFLLTPEIYANEYSRVSMVLANTGLAEIKSVVVEVEGEAVPKQFYIQSLLPSQAQNIEFSFKAKNESHLKVIAEYQYFDAGKVVEEIKSFEFDVELKALNFGLTLTAETPKISRGAGVVTISIMNSHLSPIANLRLSINASEEFDLERSEVVIGSLMPGEVAKLSLSYSLDDDAELGDKEWKIKLRYELRAGRIEEVEEIRTLRLYLQNDPYFVAKGMQTVYHGGNVVTFQIQNVGGEAEDVHFKLIPNPGIRVKMPEAFVERVKEGEVFNVSFSLDVDEDTIVGNTYRIDLSWKAENAAGRKVNGLAYCYVLVGERGWMEKYLPYLAAITAAIAVLLALRWVRKKRGA